MAPWYSPSPHALLSLPCLCSVVGLLLVVARWLLGGGTPLARKGAVDFGDLRPQLYGRSDTGAGVFEVWKFPLEFNSYIFYMRRFGVDVPHECREGQPAAPCPLLVDFHGSYDSLYSQRAWTQWYAYQTQAGSKFVLLTPEGSPDALYRPTDILTDCNDTSDSCIGKSGTSWNVSGWGVLSSPMPENSSCRASDAQENVYANCFWSTLNPDYAYQCFGTHLVTYPDVCRRTTQGLHDQIPTVCMSASGANDADYMAKVLRFVVGHYGVDTRRIYFSGQSMGGMAALEFADGSTSRQLPADLRPAAVVPCSAGASRSSSNRLQGRVPALLLWGYTDHIAPATVWQGYDRNLSRLTNMDEFGLLLRNSSLREAALQVTRRAPHMMCSNESCGSMACCTLLQANIMTGGRLLGDTAVHAAFSQSGKLGCENALGRLTGIGEAGFLWEGIASTLEGIAGQPVDFGRLEWELPSGVPKAAGDAVDLLCASVPAKESAEVRVCIFNGAHTYPWNGDPRSGEGHDWMDVAGPHGKVFHDFVWEDFLRGGGIVRPASPASPAGSLGLTGLAARGPGRATVV